MTLLLGAAACFATFFLALLPPGYALLRLARVDARGLGGVGLATAVGYSVVAPLFLAERALGGAFLVPVVTLVSLAWLRPGPDALRALRRLLPELLLPLGLAALALLVCAGDVTAENGGLSFRVGFDVSDRGFYAMVSQELMRAPLWRMENPLFAPLPFQYAYFPCLMGALVEHYTGIPALLVFLLHLPALALAFTGLATAALLDALGVGGRASRVFAALLVALGGDLSYLVEIRPSWLERTSHFFAFHSFTAESLFYNPWMLGVPVAFGGLALAGHGLRSGSPRTLALAALVLGGLFETKLFAFVPIVLGTLSAAVLFRSARLAGLGVATGLVAAPWALVTLAAGAGRGGAPLVLAPLSHVHASLAANASLRALDSRLGLGAVVIACLAGAFGLRLVGLPLLWRRARTAPAGLDAVVALTLPWAAGLSLLLAGNPVALDGVQFQFCALFLAWPYAGIVLARLWDASGLRRGLAVLLLAAAAVSPLRYVALKLAPEAWTAAGSVDRKRFALGADALEASAFLRRNAPTTDRVLVPLRTAGDAGGLGPLYLGALAGRRVSGAAADFSVAPAAGAARRQAMERVFSTADAAEAEGLIASLAADWVWEDASRPLRFTSTRLTRRHASSGVTLYQVTRP